MFLYVIEFDSYPDLVKIGIATVAEKRFSQLESAHGTINKYKIFKGRNYKQVERLLHSQFKDFQNIIPGDGGTEFFKKDFDSKDLVDILEVSKMMLVKYSFKILNEETQTLERKIVETLDTSPVASILPPIEEPVSTDPSPTYSRSLLFRYIYTPVPDNERYKRNRLKNGSLVNCPLFAEEEFTLIAAQQKKGLRSLNDIMRYCFEVGCKEILGEEAYKLVSEKLYNVAIQKTTEQERLVLKAKP